MRINHRPYRDKKDLLQIGRLLRRAHAQAPHCNAWSFARFDIWSQRRIGDDRLYAGAGLEEKDKLYTWQWQRV